MLRRLAVAELHNETARPHWLVIDEAHHLLPALWTGAPLMLPREFGGTVLITIDSKSISPDALQNIEYVAAISTDAECAIASFCETLGKPSPGPIGKPPDRGQALLWRARSGEPRIVSPIQPRLERQRHIRKYAEGELGEDNSFYFRGPQDALNLRAQNLALLFKSRLVSTTGHGSIIIARVTTRGGSETRSRTSSLRAKSLASSETKHFFRQTVGA